MVSDLLVSGLELIVALVSVLSEHLLARGKLKGWVWAIIASILAGFFFLLRGHTILALVEVLNVPFAIYGFRKWKRHVEKITKTDNIMAYGAVAVMIIYFFCEGVEANGLIQAIASGAFLIGGLLLAREKKFGWHISMVADVLLVYLMIETNDYIFVIFQTASIYIAIKKIFFEKLSEKHGLNEPCFFICSEPGRIFEGVF